MFIKIEFFPPKVFYRRKWSKKKLSVDTHVPSDDCSRCVRARKRKSIFKALITDPFQPMIKKTDCKSASHTQSSFTEYTGTATTKTTAGKGCHVWMDLDEYFL